MRFLLRPRNRRWTLLVGLVLVVMVWSLLPSTKRSIFGDTKRSLFEVEGIQCPRSPAPHDGLGVKRRLPQALVIGAMKSGTGALKLFLPANRAISVSSGEYHHFSNDTRYKQGLEVYRNALPRSRPDQITMDGSPSYWPNVPKSARRIYAMNPCVKLIVTVIDPAERLESHFAHNNAENLSDSYRDGKLVPSFHEYYFYPDGKIRTDAVGINIGLYAKNMKHWLTYFPSDRILVVDGMVLKNKPWISMRRVEGFLGIPLTFNRSQFYRRSDHKVFCHKKVRCLSRTKGRPHPYVDPEDRERLREFYRKSNEEFFEIIGRRLEWAY